MEITGPERESSSIKYSLEDGNKRLVLNVVLLEENGWAFTYVENRLGFPRGEGTTTKLYKEACRLIATTATWENTPIHYILSTEFDSMKNWAMGAGRTVFNWDSLEDIERGDGTRTLKAEKTFQP